MADLGRRYVTVGKEYVDMWVCMSGALFSWIHNVKSDHIDQSEPPRHGSASSASVRLELRGLVWNESVNG